MNEGISLFRFMENVKMQKVKKVLLSQSEMQRAPLKGNLSNGKRIKNNEDIHIFAANVEELREYHVKFHHTRAHNREKWMVLISHFILHFQFS